jgi:membrane protein
MGRAATIEGVKQWLRIFAHAGKTWWADNVFKHSAAVSFYTLFSLAPITLIAVTVGGMFLGRDIASEQLKSQLTELVGPASAQMMLSAADASQTAKGNPWATGLGIALLLVGATSVFVQLQESLNQIWGVRTKPSKSGWALLLLHRLVSFAMVLTMAFLLLVSLIITTTLTSALGQIQLDAPALLKAVDIGAGLVVSSVLFALLFKVMPDVNLRWQDVALGAVVTAVLFTIGRYLIALYLGRSTVASIYGTAGSLVALLIWVYYSCAIVFYGAEFTRAYRHSHKLKVQPKETAVVVREEIVEPRKRQPA